MKKVGLIIFGVVIVTSLDSCFEYKPKPQSNHIEEVKLPVDTFWVKSTDEDGIWVNVEFVHNHRNNATISLFDGTTKEFIERRRFILVCESDPSEFIWIENLEEQIKVFDNGIFRFDSEKCWLQ